MKIRNSQKARVIIDGVGFYTTVGAIRKGGLFCFTTQRRAVASTLAEIEKDNSKYRKLSDIGATTGFLTGAYGHQVQVDLL